MVATDIIAAVSGKGAQIFQWNTQSYTHWSEILFQTFVLKAGIV